MTRAALYVRVSSAAQVRDGYSLEFQTEILTDFCQREGWTIAGVYRDGGQSGSTLDRAGLQALVDAAGHRRFNVVLIFRVDRFSRDPVDLLYLIKVLDSYGIRLKSVTEAVDASDPAGELMLTILGAIGKFVRRNIIQNAMLGKTKRAQAGKYTGGAAPFGYVVDAEGHYTPDRRPWWGSHTVAELIPHLFERYQALAAHGFGLRSLAAELAAAGIPAPHGGAWSPTTLRQILTHPVYTGQFTYGRTSQPLNRSRRPKPPAEWIQIADAHPPLVSPALWAAVQRALQANRTTRRGRPPVTLEETGTGTGLLTGFLRCAQCGHHLATHHSTYRYHGQHSPRLHYTCARRRTPSSPEPPCRFPYIRADHLEAAVWPQIVALVERPEFLKDLITAQQSHDTARAQLAADQARLTREFARLEAATRRLVDAFVEGTIPKPHYTRKLQELEARQAALQQEQETLAQRAAAHPPAADPATLSAYLRDLFGRPDHLTTQEKRDILQAILDPEHQITVTPDRQVTIHLRLPAVSCHPQDRPAAPVPPDGVMVKVGWGSKPNLPR